jgi:hypothetical protein
MHGALDKQITLIAMRQVITVILGDGRRVMTGEPQPRWKMLSIIET